MALQEIASLWIGGQLSWLEQLCLKSFVDAGHRVTLFTYETVEGIPDEIHVEDANSIYPADRIIRHARTGSPAYHADVFRLHMLRDTDLCWVDTDAYCVRPFEIPDHGHWHGWISDDVAQINNGVLKLPKESLTLKGMLELTSDEYPIPPWYSDRKKDELVDLKRQDRGVHVSLLPWGVWGPDALTHYLHDTGEVRYTQAKHVIYPVPFSRKRTLLKPRMKSQVEEWVKEDTASIHFWGRRFRSAASETGGIPHPKSYTAMLLDRHGIDPEPTAHMMRPVGRPDPGPWLKSEDLDLSMFGTDDLTQVMLQRSVSAPSDAAVRAWSEGDDGPMRAEATARGTSLVRAAFDDVQHAYAVYYPVLHRMKPARIADIGAGAGFVDLLIYRNFGCDLVLIDIEENGERHFGFADSAAGTASLTTARAFLIANGVPEEKITTINPNRENLEDAGIVDLALSFYSCGFHYPAETYDDFFMSQVSPAGAIVLDVRKGSGGIPYLKKFGRTKLIRQEPKFATVHVEKGFG